MKTIACVAVLSLLPSALPAGELAVQNVAPGIWAIVGPAEQRSPQNLGNNATFGLIETGAGAVLIDPGGTRAGAEALAAVVQRLTTEPVAWVIDTGGQDHRWLGNGYWQSHGAQVIASQAAVADQTARAATQLMRLTQLVGEAAAGTEPSFADVTFDAGTRLEIGDRRLEIRHVAPAHTPGDSFVWLPDAGVVFTGDIVFVGRLLGVMEFSDTAGWLDAFGAIGALAPTVVVPGHGPATSLDVARADTRDYLVTLRGLIGALIEDGGDILDAVEVDQSAFSRLDQFDALARRNAQTVFEQMEWE